LFQISTIFSLRSPFRAKGVLFFCIGLRAQLELLACLLQSFGLPDRTLESNFRYPITMQFSWFFTAHTLMTCMTPILNGGMLALSKRAYFFVEIAIIAAIIWFGPAGLVIPAYGFHWVNACMLYVFAGFFGVHGWPFSCIVTWILFFAIFVIDRAFMATDIFTLVPAEWHWAVLTFRLHVLLRRDKYIFSENRSVGYVCPLNYFWGAVALYAFQTLSFPASISKVICFLATKVFMIHFLDCAINVYGYDLIKLVRPSERVTPPSNGNINAGLVSIQALSYGVLAEIYRERAFIHVFNAIQSVLCWAVGVPTRIWSLFARAFSPVHNSGGSQLYFSSAN
jgi:hypothetical protein